MYSTFKYSDSDRYSMTYWAIIFNDKGDARMVRNSDGQLYTFLSEDDASNFAAALNFGKKTIDVFPKLLKQFEGVQ
jgi:hypothetical protein